MSLDQDQKDFIDNKVKELGSEETVKKLYFKDDLVSAYAKVLANKLFGKRKERK